MVYNVRLKHYRFGDVQSSLYSSPIISGAKRHRLAREVEPTEADRDASHRRSVQNSLKRAKNKIYDIARSNAWDYFVTFTFSKEKVDRYNYDDCSKKLSVWLNNMRKSCSADFRYIVVPEMHKDGAFHFHGLFANCDGLSFVDSGKRDKSGSHIYNISSYRIGFTTATEVKNQFAATKYITKYTTKDLMEGTKNKRKYWCSKNCARPLEEYYMLDAREKRALSYELENGALNYKNCTYTVGLQDRMVEYFEHNGLTLNSPLWEVR